MVTAMNQLHAGGWAGDDEQVSVTGDGRVYPVAPVPPRRMPIKTRVVELDGDYAGWRATVRTNAPFANFLRLSQLSGEDNAATVKALGEVYAMLPKLVHGWNFVDEDGEPLPCNAEGFAQLPTDLVLALVGAIGNAGADDPKG